MAKPCNQGSYAPFYLLGTTQHILLFWNNKNIYNMERGDIFEFTDKGVLVRAVCIRYYRMDFYEDNGYTYYLCYAQNRLFHYIHYYSEDFNCDTETWETQESWELGDTLVDYCVIPEFDEVLKSYE